ncbi:MAG: amino acid adenylation domain-containing protein [Bacteroidetes bacterium]|nr:amino acid adenylation domain-containing protein [Bacteroidota bacterium]
MSTVIHIFRHTAGRFPSRLAVSGSGRSLSFSQFDSLTDQLAHFLLKLGLERGQLVCILLDRTTDYLVAVFGVLKAGGAYVPVDASQGAQRIQQILDDCKARILVGPDEGLPQGVHFEGTYVSQAMLAQLPELPKGFALPELTADAPAYVIFTSGTTGRPKGVVITHQNLMTQVDAYQQLCPVNENDRTLINAPFSFDVSVHEIFTTLIWGAEVEILGKGKITDIPSLVQHLTEGPVTIMYLPPQVVEVFASYLHRHHIILPLRRLLVGVEPIRQSVLERIRQHMPNGMIINGYGPTEATVSATAEIFTGIRSDREIVSIGTALPGYTVLLLDEALQPVADGSIGQIAIGGRGVSPGYLNDPELTSRKFVKGILPHAPEERFYLTGDLAFRLPDGNIEFVGRSDFQVKIRGHRVELGEIDAALMSVPQVLKAITVVVEPEPGLKQLVAFYLADGQPDGLKAQLALRLPEYMIPALLVRLEQFPVNASGKTDREALVRLAKEKLLETHAASQAEPTDLLEKIYRKNLPASTFDADLPYYQLGGDSIGVMVLLIDLYENFGLQLPPEWLSSQGSLNALRKLIHESDIQANRSQTPILCEDSAAGRDQKCFPVTPAQQALYFLHRIDGLECAHNIFLRIEIKGEVRSDVIHQAVSAIVGEHDILRAAMQLEKGKLCWKILPELQVEIEGISPAPGQRIDDLEFQLSRHVFKLGEAPLWRMHLLELNAAHKILYFNIHHSIFDGWSAGLFINSLKNKCNALVHEVKAVAVRSFSFESFVRYQAQQVSSGAWDSDINYWRKVFEELPQPLFRLESRLPDFSRGRRHSWKMPLLTVEKLKLYARTNHTTLFVTLLAPFMLSLFKKTGKGRGMVATVYANRQLPPFDRMIGYFTNVVAIGGHSGKHMTIREFVHRLTITCNEAFAHARYPYDLLIKKCGLAHSFDHNPVYQCFFIFQNWMPALLEDKLPKAETFLSTFGNGEDASAHNCAIAFEELGSHTAKALLTMDCTLHKDALECWLEYPVNLFSEAEIGLLAESYNQLLELMLSNSETMLSELGPGEALTHDYVHAPALKLPQASFLTGLFREPYPAAICQISVDSLPAGLRDASPRARLISLLCLFAGRISNSTTFSFPVTIQTKQGTDPIQTWLHISIEGEDAFTVQWLKCIRQIEKQIGLPDNIPVDATVSRSGGDSKDENQIDETCPLHIFVDCAAGIPGEGELLSFGLDSTTNTLFFSGFDSEESDYFTGSKLKESFRTFLKAGLSNDRPLNQLSILPDEELSALKQVCNEATAASAMDLPSVTELFQKCVVKYPDKPALVEGETVLTYAELDDLIHRIRAALDRESTGNQKVVGILASRSVWYIAGLMAVLSSGRAFVPIDANWPESRIEEILSDARPSVLLVVEDLSVKPIFSSVRILNIKTLSQFKPGDTSPAGPKRSDAAYIIYTSGTTGRPKGVLISHGALAAFTQSAIQRYEIVPTDVILQFASLTFDAAVEEIFCALGAGATLVLRNDEMMTNAKTFADFLAKHQITVLDLPTAFWAQMTRAMIEAQLYFPAHLRLVIIGGEKASWPAAEAWKEHFGNSPELINTYGPTETTVVVASCKLSENKAKDDFAIGYPLGKNCLVVLDNQHQVLPDGFVGELGVIGPQLADEYLNKPETTAEKFVTLQTDFASDVRCYLTGDLVLRNKYGQLIYKGRKDRQLKIRGYRIEPEEIDAAARRLPGIFDAFTTLARLHGKPVLTTYVKVKEPENFDGQSLLRHLHGMLPDYMCPAAVVPLHDFPLTRNLKIDEHALPLPELPDEAYAVPAQSYTPIQAIVVETYSKILNVSKIFLESNFFRLGGDSLQVLACISELSKQTGVNLSIGEFYQNPSVAQLAELIEAKKQSLNLGMVQLPPGMVCLQHKADDTVPVVTVFLDRGNLYLPELLPDRAIYTFLPEGSDGEQIQRTNVHSMAEFYASHLINHLKYSRFILIGYSFGGLVAAEMASILVRQGIRIERLILIDTPAPWVWRELYHPVAGLRKHINLFSKRLRLCIYLFFNKPLPEKYRNFYIRWTWYKAARNHIPQAPRKPVRLQLVVAVQNEFDLPDLGWDREKGFQPQIIKIWGNHHDLVRNRVLFTEIVRQTALDAES